MKKLVTIVGLFFFSLQKLVASSTTISVINQSSDQISITLQTAIQTVTQSALPNENQNVNTMNNSVLTSSSISYTSNPLQKIMINRLSTSMPQIIYYNDEVTTDQYQLPCGIYDINLKGSGSMIVMQDSVIINNLLYDLMNLQSCIIKCNQLNSQLSSTNIPVIEQAIDDLNAMVQLMQSSDKNMDIAPQLIALQSQISSVKNNISMMDMLNKNLAAMQNLLTNLSAQNSDETQTSLENLEIGLQTVMQSHLQGALYAQLQAVQNSIQKLQIALQQFGVEEKSINYEFLIPYKQDLTTGYQQITTNV